MKQIALIVCAFLLLSWHAFAFAQEYVVQVSQIDNTNYPEVTVYVNVTDSAGQQVGTLPQEVFSITEDGSSVDLMDFGGVSETRPVDIVFVFDTTGSMDEEINGLKQTAIDFAQQLREKNRDFRLGLLSFGDQVFEQFNTDGTLTDDETVFQSWVSGLQADGGEDEPENAFGAIKVANNMRFRDGAQVIFILITDAPPHHYGDDKDSGVAFDDPDLTGERILEILATTAVTVYPVTYNDPDFRRFATETGGRFYDLNRSTDFTDIIDDIGETIASQYKLTYQSPRPTYDGTRRQIEVLINQDGAVTVGTGDYLEQHLLQIESNWQLGSFLLLFLLGILLVPLWQRPQPTLPQSGDIIIPHQTAQPCPQCQAPLQPNTNFCSTCGAGVQGEQTCTHCGASLQPQVRFCTACGHPTQPR